MKKVKHILLGVILMSTFLFLSGCGNRQEEHGSIAEDIPVEETAPDMEAKEDLGVADSPALEETTGQADGENEESSDGSAEEAQEFLYITLDGHSYESYPYHGESTPEGLLKGIEELTGWNLSLADEITTGKGGISVTFAEDACLFTGPPEEQKEEFHVYDATQLVLSVLGSVQATLQNWASPAAPDNVDIYYAMGADIKPLTIENLGVTWPIDEPYSSEGMEERIS